MMLDTTLLINGPHLDFRPLIYKGFLLACFYIEAIYGHPLDLLPYKIYLYF